MADFDDLLAQPSGGPFDTLLAPAAGIRQKPRSAGGEIWTGVRGGVTEGLPLQAGQAMQWLGEPTGGGFRQSVYEKGKSIADAAKARQELPENKLRPGEHGAVVNSLAEGGEMLAPSVAAPLVVGGGLALAGAASPALAVGAGTGLAISSVLGVAPAAMQQGQQTLESVKAAGASDEVARSAGWKNLAIEGAGEALGTYVGGKFVGIAGKALGKAASPTVAGTLAKATDTAVWKPFAKGLVTTAVGEVGTEIGQAVLQASVEREAGVDVDPFEQMKGVVGPTLGMTAFLAPFGLHANYSNARSAKAVNTIIEDPQSATPEQRQAVVDELHKQAVANKVPDADQWLTGAKEDIAAGLPIRRVANVIREEQVEPADPATQAAPATNTVQAETLNQATPDEVKIDKVEDGVATVTVGDRTVELPVKEAAEAVAKGNLEEVLAEKEAKPVVEELPQEVSLPTTTFLRQDGETRGFLPPEGKTIDDVRAETEGLSPAEKLNWFKENKASNYRYKLLDKQEEPEIAPLEEQRPAEPGAFERLQAGAEPAPQEVRNDNPEQDTSQVAGTDPLQTGGGVLGEAQGDLRTSSEVAGQSAEAAQTVNDEFSVPEEPAQAPEEVQARLAETEAKFAPKEPAPSDGSFEALDSLSETATKQTITTGDLFTTLEQSPDENVKKLGGFLKSFTPGSKLETAVKVDPAAKTAGYAPGKNEITVKDLKNAPTSLHELVHSVTVRELKVRPDMQKRVREVMALVKAQVTQLGLISKDTISNIEIAGGSKAFKNKFLAGELSGMEQIGYGLLNEQEFLAQAFSSPQFQGVLKATQIKTGGKYRSAWDALVEKVMQVLGIEAKHASAFSEALSIAAQLASTDVSGAPLQAQSTKGGSTFVARVQEDLKKFLGKGYDNLVKRGKLEVVRNANDLGTEGEVLRTSKGTVAGSYFPSQKKVVLFSDNLQPGDVEDIMRHEAGHALLNEDKVFRAKRSAILKDFAYLAKNNPKIKEAFDKVPADTAKGFRGEEALLYWIQNPSNRKHSIFKRIISAVKAALYRLGIAHGRLSESDLVALFSQGTKAWSRREQDQDLTKGRTLGEVLGEFAQDAKLSVKEAGRKIQGLDAFKKWFGDSKVVDENGEPLVVYHGTNASDFSTFDTKTPEASWFSADPSYAGEYADGEEDARLYPVYLRLTNPFDFGFRDTLTRVTIADMASRVKQGVLDSFAAGRIGKDEARKLVADLDDVSRRKVHVGVYSPVYQWWQGEFALTDALRAAGYDGIVAREGGKSQYPTFAVFEPTQIKSIFNRGTWSQTDPDILFSVVSDKMKEGRKKVDQILDAVQDPKSRLRDIYVKYAPQWLAVMPRSHLAQTLGKRIHWLADIDKHNKKMEAIKAQLPDDFYAIYQDAERIAEKNSGLKAFNNLLLTGTFNQMAPWLDLEEQDWYGKSLVETEKAWKKEGMAKTTGKSFAEAHQEVRTAWNGLKPAEQEQVKKIVDYLASLRERERNNLLAVIEASSEGNPTLREQLMTQFNATFGKLKGIYLPLSRYGEYILKFTTKDGREQTEFFMSPGERRVFRKQMEDQGVDPDTFVEDVKRETQKGEAVIPQALREQLGKALEAKYLTGVDLEDAGAVSEAQARAADAFSDLNQVILRWMPETSALKNSIHRKNVLGASTDMLRSSMDYVLRHAGSIAWMEYGRKIEEDIQGFEQENKDKVTDREGSINMDMRTHLVNDARRWFQAVKNERVSPIASTLGKFSTAYYMTSPSTFLVQLTQLPVLTLPALSRKFSSLPKATAALTEGLRKAFSKKYSKDAMYGDADVNRVYADLHLKVTEKNRVGDRQLGEDFYSPAEKLQRIKGLKSDYQRELLALRESLARGDLDISAVHEASDIAQGKQTTAVGKALRYAMLPMQHGELGSRKATVLATYKLATDKKQDFFSALNDSSEVVGGTLYNYAKSDKGWFMQGDTVRTLTTFQTYRIKTALRMGILLMQALKGENAPIEQAIKAGASAETIQKLREKSKEVRQAALKEFLGVTAMSAALAGVHGTIIGSMVFGLANLFGGDDDEPYDAEMEFDKWVTENAGSLFGGIISYGLPTAVGTNLSKRIGMGDLYGVSSEPPENMHGAQLAAWYAGNLIGPSFSVAQSWVKGYDQMVNKGNYMRGLEEALPKPLKDGLKAIRVASDGLKTGAGKKLLADEAIGPDEILMIGLGFQPDEVAKAQGAERSLNKIGTQLSERRGRLIRDAAKAIVDSEDTEGPMSAIATFNAKLPLFAINGSDLRPAVRRLVLGEVGTTGLRQRQIASQFGVPVYMGE
jgi:hypothetical protein